MTEKPTVKKIPLRSYTKKELRKLYGISRRTWNQWVMKYKDELKLCSGRTLTIKEVELIFETFGIPGEIALD